MHAYILQVKKLFKVWHECTIGVHFYIIEYINMFCYYVVWVLKKPNKQVSYRYDLVLQTR